MSSDNILKKSVIGGFKKEGVLNYVEQLQEEIVSLKKELSENSVRKKELDTVADARDAAEKELHMLREENEALKAENVVLIERNAAISLKMEEAEVTISDYESKLKLCEDKIALIESKFSDIEKNYYEYGAAISNAKKSATDVYSKTRLEIETAKDEINQVNDRLKTACINFENSVISLKNYSSKLVETLSTISDNLRTGEE